MKVSDLMAQMIAAGAPVEAVLIAVRAIEERDEAIAAKRAVDRDRKRRQRSKDRDMDGTVTGQSRDMDGTVTDEPSLSLPPNENNSNPPTHTHPDKNTRARKGHRLPVDWEPETLTGDAADAVACWPPGAVERELSRFRDWAASATGPNAVKSNWQAAWRNWIRKAEDDGRYGRKPQQSARPSLVDIGRAVAADLEREAQARASF